MWKRLVLIACIVAVPAWANAQEGTNNDTDQSNTSGRAELNAASEHSTEIDGVMVPLDVLVFVNTEYLGHAVSGVDTVKRNGATYYRLLIERGTADDNAANQYLYYDLSWELQDELKVMTPIKRSEPKVPEPKKNEAEESNDADVAPEQQDANEQDENSSPDPEEEETQPKPEEEDADETEESGTTEAEESYTNEPEEGGNSSENSEDASSDSEQSQSESDESQNTTG